MSSSPSRRTSSWAWWILRVLITVWFLEVAFQIVLAAGFVSGSTAWFTLHSINGSSLVLLPMLAFPVALVNALVARGAWWPVAVLPVAFILVVAQMVLGYTRSVGVHIVGGVIVFAFALVLCLELWRRRHRPRPPRMRRGSTP